MLEDVAIEYGDRVLFDGVNVRIAAGDRIGLIGPNGSGKTTLLKLISGRQTPDRGTLTTARGVEIGYLPQDLSVEGGQTLRGLVMDSIPGRASIAQDLARTEEELAQAVDGDDHERVSELGARVAELHERADHFERFYSEHVALQILAGLGFKPGDERRDIAEFSGGWRVRGALAAILFQRPALMLLDEPTNHLDLPSVAWFGSFLAQSKHAMILISHDREFLNEQINRVVSIELEGVRSYTGNYDRYVKQREEEEQILIARAKNQAREREHLETIIERFRYKASKASAVQSRVKQLEKMEEVELYAQRRTMRFSFPPCERAPGEVLRITNLAKSYGEHKVFAGLNLQVRRGEKVALIGPNGAGKTTLLRLIAGELEATAGQVQVGNGITIGYYAQHHADTLHRDSTAYQEVQRASPDTSPARIRSILGAFLFSGDDVDKKVAVLSGGERARLALARLLVKPGNLLLMDEPTNHLDLWSSESLGESLGDYDGTLVFVSHNRSLIRRLATRIWNVEAGTVETYPGTLDEYLYSKQLRAQEESPATETAAQRNTQRDDRERKRREAEARQKRSKLLGPIEKRIAEYESRITSLENAQAVRSEALSDPDVYGDKDQRNELLGAFQSAATELETLTEAWEKAQLELEQARAQLGDENAG